MIKSRYLLTDEINDDNWIVLAGSVVVAGLVEEKGRHVGREDGGVDDQEEDDPVPQCLRRDISSV